MTFEMVRLTPISTIVLAHFEKKFGHCVSHRFVAVYRWFRFVALSILQPPVKKYSYLTTDRACFVSHTKIIHFSN